MFDTNQTAVFIEEHGVRHRVWLRRHLRDGVFKPAVFVLKNPSIAAEIKNDPTSKRGVGFAIAWDCTDLIFVNVSTQVSTNPKLLDPAHLNCEWSDWALEQAVKMALDNDGELIAAWGTPAGNAETCRKMAERMLWVRSRYVGFKALRMTAHGYPEHPLYIPACTVPLPY